MTLPARAFLARRILQRGPQFLPRRLQSTNCSSHPKEPPNANFTSHAPANPPSSELKTIPGPIWVWTQPLNSYSRVHKRRPYTVQIISTLIIYFFGDMAAQRINPTPRDETAETTSASSST